MKGVSGDGSKMKGPPGRMSRPKPFPRALLSLVSCCMAFRPYERAIRLPDRMTLQGGRQNVSKKRMIGLGSVFCIPNSDHKAV